MVVLLILLMIHVLVSAIEVGQFASGKQQTFATMKIDQETWERLRWFSSCTSQQEYHEYQV